MVVPKRLEWSKNIWIFIKPFSWDLWLTILAASIVTGCAVYILECHHADQTQQSAPTKYIETILWLPLSSLYYAESNIYDALFLSLCFGANVRASHYARFI